jgi:hypothetical protein
MNNSGSLKGLDIPLALAEMLSCKLLPIVADLYHEAFVLYMM